MCRYIAHHGNVIIAQVDFRLAPEHPIPTQVNDCFDAFKWVGSPLEVVSKVTYHGLYSATRTRSNWEPMPAGFFRLAHPSGGRSPWGSR